MTGHHPACKATRARQYADQALADGLLPLILPQDSRRRIIVPHAGLLPQAAVIPSIKPPFKSYWLQY
ncbi:uncharacterized protein ARMOST_20120 [Armillaria ostoyae]|uniref:Uncharacterized protein n=1 Tax=Armillaria ostoyae TaxID=47428 RepID=A0A284S6G9_ARMOS|nr:uncharacterized protein ARMOST_20120 [Armillaria ostoyae]